MKCWFVRTSRGIRPAYAEDIDKCRVIPQGTVFEVSTRVVRNPKNHRRFFALVKMVSEWYAENGKDGEGAPHPFSTTDGALLAVKLAAGHVDWIPNPNTGDMTPIPKSIGFDTLDEADFQEFFGRAIDGVISHLIPNTNSEQVNEHLNEVVRFA